MNTLPPPGAPSAGPAGGPPPPVPPALTSRAAKVVALVGAVVVAVAVGAAVLWATQRDGDDGSTTGNGAGVTATGETTRRRDSATTAPGGSGPMVEIVDLELGMCFEPGDTLTEDLSLQKQVEEVPCDESHTAEVVLVHEPSGDEYDQDAVKDEAVETCGTEGSDRIDPTGQPRDLRIIYYMPTSERWEQGEREIVCSAHSEQGLTGSVRD